MSNEYKIALVLPFLGLKGGRATYSYHLLSNLLKVESDLKYYVITPQEVELPQSSKVIPHVIKQDDLSFRGIDKWMRKVIVPEDASLLFMSYFVIPDNIPQIPTVVVIHDLNMIEIYTKRFLSQSGILRYPYKLISTDALWSLFRDKERIRKVSHVIAISRYTAERVKELLKYPEERISVIYNGTDHIKIEAKAKCERLAISQPYIFYVGGAGYKKNLGRLYKAFKLLKKRHNVEHKLVMVGEGYWYNKLKDREEVIFEVRVSSECLRWLYNNADVFVYPSILEGFGFPPVEAKLAGTKVAVSVNVPSNEILKDKVLKFNPFSVMEMYEALKKLVVDRVEQESISIDEIPTWGEVAEKYIEIFLKLLS